MESRYAVRLRKFADTRAAKNLCWIQTVKIRRWLVAIACCKSCPRCVLQTGYVKLPNYVAVTERCKLPTDGAPHKECKRLHTLRYHYLIQNVSIGRIRLEFDLETRHTPRTGMRLIFTSCQLQMSRPYGGALTRRYVSTSRTRRTVDRGGGGIRSWRATRAHASDELVM